MRNTFYSVNKAPLYKEFTRTYPDTVLTDWTPFCVISNIAKDDLVQWTLLRKIAMVTLDMAFIDPRYAWRTLRGRDDCLPEII